MKQPFKKTYTPFILAFSLYQLTLFLGPNLHRWPGLLLLPFICLLIKNTFTQDTNYLNPILNKKYFLTLLIIQTFSWILVLILDYFSISYNLFDTGIFAHVIINLKSGREFYNHILQRPAFSVHFIPNLALFVPFFKIFSSPLWLPFFKFLGYLSCLPLLWKISGFYLKNIQNRYAILLLWLINYPILSVLNFEFQSSTLALPFILLSFYLWLKKKPLLLILNLVFILGFREHLALVWISVGLWVILFEKKQKNGILLIISGLILGLLIVYIITPFFSKGIESQQLIKFGPLTHLLAKLKFIFFILLSVGFLPLLKPKTLLFIIPAMAISLISNTSTMFTLNFHYQDLPVTITFMGVILGLASLEEQKSWLLNLKPLLKKTLTISSLISIFLFNTFYPTKTIRKNFPTEKDLKTIQEIKTIKTSLDKNKTIWCIDSLGIYFLDFPYLRSIQDTIEPFEEKADYIVTADLVNLWPIEKQYQIFKNELQRLVKARRYKQISNGNYLEVYQLLMNNSE